MKTATIDEYEIAELDFSGGPTITRLFEPETGAHATMIEGDEEEVSSSLIGIFEEIGVL
jgi:hypothetical protein